MPASSPPHSQLRTMTSCASTSSFCCVSPCTFLPPCSPRYPPSAPLAVIAEIALTAAATSTSSAPRSLAPGMSVSCWIRNFESVVRPRYIVASPRWSWLALAGGGLEHAAGANVGTGDGRQLFSREAPILVGKQSARLAQSGTVERVAHAACVGEVRLADASGQILLERRARAGSETVVLPLEELIGDAQQLGGRVVREIQMVRDARTHPGIGAEEAVHAILVARQDYDQIVALVLHDLQQDLDGLLSVVALVLGPVEVVRLIDEEHAAHRPL